MEGLLSTHPKKEMILSLEAKVGEMLLLQQTSEDITVSKGFKCLDITESKGFKA